MIQVRLKLPLDDEEYAVLMQVALDELRSPADEVRFILRQEFERRGLIPAAAPNAAPRPEGSDTVRTLLGSESGPPGPQEDLR